MSLKKLLCLCILLCAMFAYGTPVEPSVAKQVACNFWSVNAGKTNSVDLVNVTGQFGFQEFYIFVHPQGKGYVIVAADDCVQPIIGYSLSSSFVSPLPAHVQDQLQGYEEEIAYYKSAGSRATGEIVELWQSMRNGSYTPRNTTSVSPMLTTTWNQSPYYNDLCPDSAGVHAVTGCAATATAQVMKFWNWPVTGTGSHTYTDDNEGSYNFGTLTANFGATTYQWSLMPNALNSSSSAAQINAVATLMFHIGVAIEMDYGIGSSGAYTNSYGYAELACSENALKDYFGYKNTLYSVYKDQTTDTNWVSILTAEMDAGRPVIEAGHGGGGHAFVVDGYDNNGLFHINWGWGSAYDGYFAHNALNPGGGGTGSGSTHSYNDNQSLVVGIEPSGLLHTNTSNILLPQEGGTASFIVSSSATSSVQWTATSSQSWLTVSPSTGAGSGLATTVNVTASANNTGAVRQAIVTITQGSQSVMVTVSQNECATADMCQITLEMEDSYGDGWNGSYLTLSSSSGFVYGTATFSDGNTATQQFNVCPSDLVFTWSSGQYDDECSFTVYNASNQLLLTASYPFNNSYMVTTPCAGGTQPPTTCEVTTFPWSESFEDDIDCWTMIDADGDGYNWGRTTGMPYDGTYMMYSYSYYSSTPLNSENYLISPQITLPSTGTYQLSFYARCANNNYPDSILVKLSTTTNSSVSAFNTTLMSKTMIPATYQQYTINLSGYNGQSFYLAFVHDSYDGYYLLLDNVSIVNTSQSYTITATSANNAMGTVTGGGTYAAGTEVSLEATANAGYRFTGWDDGTTDNPRNFMAMANASYTAYFADLGTNELHYDNGTVVNSMGAGGTIYWAVRFPASVLTTYTTLNSVRIWDAYAGSYEVRICQGGTDAPGTQLATQTYTLNGSNAWFDATLSTPVTINPAQPLWIVLYNTGVTYPAAGSTYVGNPDGSWVSLDGNTWNSICDYGFYYTWMVRPVLSSGSTPQTYTITAVSANTSMGEVIGGGTYAAGTTAQLMANAYPGYEFVNWQDGNTSNPRYITVTGNASYTAYFQAISTNCTVTNFPWSESFENGWNCWTTIDADGDGNYWGRTDNLPAQDGDYTLYSYSFDSNNNLAIDAENYLISPQITLPSTGNYQLTFYARCANSSYPDSLWVKMSTTGNTNVSAFNTTLMTKTVIAASYQQYTVSLSGHNGQSFYLAFVHDSYNGYVVLLDNISIVDASVSYTITATSANTTMGTASGGGTYSSGAEVTLEAMANPGYRFTSWNDGITDNPRNFTAMANASYTAYFADLGSNELHYDNGTYQSSMGAGGTLYWAVRFPASVLTTYTTLNSVRIMDIYAGSYDVRICQGGTDAPGTQVASQTFSLSGSGDWYDATFTSPVSINSNQPLWIVLYNTGVTYPAAASTYAGNPDGSWISLDGTTWNSICDYNYYLSWMVRPVLSAGSVPQTYTITAVSANTSMGEVIGGGTYAAGAEVTLEAVANPGYRFTGWNDGSTENPLTFTATANASYTAYFADLGTNELHYDNGTYQSSMGAGGTIYWAVRFPASVLTSYTTLNSVRIMDIYAGSYEVRICQGGTDAPGTQVASQTFSLSGTEDWYNAVFSTPVTINPAQPLWIVLYNTGTTYPAAGSTYAGNSDGSWVSLDGTTWDQIYSYGNFYYTWMIRPVLSAGSTPQTYTITAVSSNTSMGEVIGGGTYAAGTTVQLRANARPGYEFVNWNDGNTDNPRNITVVADATYVANFQLQDGINDNGLTFVNVYSYGNQVVVCHAEGECIEIYDMLGKRVAYDALNSQETRQFTISTKGIYLVRVGNTYFKKVIIK